MLASKGKCVCVRACVIADVRVLASVRVYLVCLVDVFVCAALLCGCECVWVCVRVNVYMCVCV